MGRKESGRDLRPRRKRMQRADRLRSAKAWLASYGGKRVVAGYARWYGVDRICAVIELRLIGVEVPAEYEAAVRQSMEGTGKARAARRAVRQQPAEAEWPDDWPEAWCGDPDWCAPEGTAHEWP